MRKDEVIIDLENNLANLLSSYLLGQKSFLECNEWFSTIDWGSIDIASEIARTIGKLQLISTEVSEGLRLESEFEQEASKVVADISRASCMRNWIPRPERIVVSSSSTDNIRNAIFMPVEGQELRSWSISPQVVSG